LTKPISMPPCTGRRLRRSGAGEVSCAAESGRNMKNSVSPCCAAKWSRRRLSARMCGCQNRTAPHAPLFRTCSTLHNASAERGARIQISCDGANPRDARAMACGACGGSTMTMLRLATLTSAGASRRISPIPGCWTSRSISVPTGHPPPGSWPDNATWPVSTHRTSARASCDARHNEGCKVSGAGTLEAVIALDRQWSACILAVTPAVDNFAIPSHCR